MNNIMYNRYVESARVNFTLHHGRDSNPDQQVEWNALVTPYGLGLILKNIRAEFKFVRCTLQSVLVICPANAVFLH